MRGGARVLLACLSLGACDTFESTPADGGDAIDASQQIDAATPIDAARDTGMDASQPTRWLATKITLDVWWPNNVLRDPGRGELAVYTLSAVTGDCLSGAVPTVRVCGVAFPVTTTVVRCEAYASQIADSAWDAPSAPTHALIDVGEDGSDAGEVMRGAEALIGLGRDTELLPGDGGAAWGADTYACAAGQGAVCFPDHDGDGQPGITLTYRDDLATYVGPYDTGECSWPRPYAYRSPTAEFICAGGICGPQPKIKTHRVGLRLSLPSRRAVCGLDAPSAARVELVHQGCAVDLATLDNPTDPRLASGNDECTDVESGFMAHTLAHYEVLRVGELPGDTNPPYGWIHISRDIDRTPSEGTRSVTVELNAGDIDAGDDGEPSCAQVRAVLEGM